MFFSSLGLGILKKMPTESGDPEEKPNQANHME
jgi:hypothetical protein